MQQAVLLMQLCIHRYATYIFSTSINSAKLLSLSTVVFNSRDWSEIVWLPEILRFKNQPCNRLYLKKPAGICWLSYNDAASWLNSNISAYSQF